MKTEQRKTLGYGEHVSSFLESFDFFVAQNYETLTII